MQISDLQNLVFLARIGLQVKAADLSAKEGSAAYDSIGAAEEFITSTISQAEKNKADQEKVVENEDGTTSSVNYVEVGNEDAVVEEKKESDR